MIDRVYFYEALNSNQNLFGGHISGQQKQSIDSIFSYWDVSSDFDDIRWLAYMLATAYHETAQTMMPIRERGKGAGHVYGKRMKSDKKTEYDDTEEIFYGRGLVQLTWYENYERAGKLCKVDMIKKADLAMDMDNAIKIMFAGMKDGWFTGKKLKNYFPAQSNYSATSLLKTSVSPTSIFGDDNNPLWCPVPNPAAGFGTPYLRAPQSLLLLPEGDWFNARRIINGTDCAEKIKGYALDFFRCLTKAPDPVKSYWIRPQTMYYIK